MNQHLLMIEDDARLAAMVAQYLEQSGFTVRCAGDGQSGLEQARKLKPDLILSDVMMPGMSGPELLERLSAIAPRARAILMSGHAESTVLPQRPAMQWAFLPKPFTPERLARKVREILDTPRPD